MVVGNGESHEEENQVTHVRITFTKSFIRLLFGDFHGRHDVIFFDFVDDILTFNHFAKHAVLAIQVRCRSMRDEKLRTVGVGTRVGHGQNAWSVVT